MAKTRKLPKRIAGVKLPKAVRKGRVGKFLGSRAGQALIAESVMALAAVATARKVADDGVPQPLRKLREAGKDAGQATSDTAAAISFAIGEAARAFTAALRDGGDPPAAFDERRSKKKPAPSTDLPH